MGILRGKAGGFSTSQGLAWQTHWAGIGRDVESKIDEVIVKGAALVAAKTLIQETPIDRGMARGNFEVDKVAGTGFNESRFDDGVATFNRLSKKIMEMGRFSQITIWDGVPYMEFLDKGTSKMRAFAMTEKARLQVERYLTKASG